MRHLRSTLPLAALLCALAAGSARADDGPAQVPNAVPELKTFDDWIVGCDNIRRCTATGHAPGRSAAGYVVIRRGAEAEAPVRIALVTRTETPIKTPVTLSIRVDGHPVSGLPPQPLPAAPDANDDAAARVDLEGAQAMAFLAALREGKTLATTVTGADRPRTRSTVSLSGAMNTFLHMDAQQMRTGTVTALATPGPAPASTVPPPPALPVLTPVLMTEMKDPPATLPPGITPADPDDCPHASPPEAVRLSSGRELWSVCETQGAYNVLQHYWIVDQGRAAEAAFEIPGRRPETGSAAVLVNSGLSDDGLTVDTFMMGRGIGDCGMHAAWVWTGDRFQLAFFAEMDDCRGVPMDDWPILYTTKWK
ncbi:MAG: DUF1176 domain-containing protein [Rhizobiales bacterium]|nr:DUF1176 domain-containing protein [Hyphomicrobiales bacterium]